MRSLGNRAWAVGLAAAVVLSLAAASAEADSNSRGQHRGDDRGRRSAQDSRWRDSRWRQPTYRYRDRGAHFVVVRRPRTAVVRPAYPYYFVVRRPRFLVVRPVPCWPQQYGSGVSARVGIHTGGLNLSFGFEKRSPYYGCDFCGAYFSNYNAWAAHVRSCPEGPGGPVLCEPWDQGDLDGFRQGAAQAWQNYDPNAPDGADQGDEDD
jgi:hypothetical protein